MRTLEFKTKTFHFFIPQPLSFAIYSILEYQIIIVILSTKPNIHPV
jgi:hypothetical protein